jgi:hypothetical protein
MLFDELCCYELSMALHFLFSFHVLDLFLLKGIRKKYTQICCLLINGIIRCI